MHVQELLIYPVKSCAGIKVQEALVTKYGLALPSNPRIFDRRWMIVKDGRHQSQRFLSRMALIQPSFVKDGLCLQAPNMPDLHISINPLPKELMQCYFWDDPVLGLRYDDNVSHWLRTFFEMEDKLDLVVFDDQKFEGRLCKNCEVPNIARDGDVVAYHDMSPVHLCSLESVFDLNTRLKKKIQVFNFRPNIVVGNVDKPYAEDCWREIEVGEVKLTWITACISYRLKPDTYRDKALFGIDLAPTDADKTRNVFGTIRVGDPIRVIKDEPNFWEKKGL
ncbi:unnamed protein product [Rotaria sp. Silwood1]|nr:unnamed protein product [Rotaria sp. Silwood1]